MTQQLIKLIWEFHGDSAQKTAEHHAIHLNEYLEQKDYPIKKVGHTLLGERKAIAYLIVLEKDMIQFRDSLKPHYGEYVKNEDLNN